MLNLYWKDSGSERWEDVLNWWTDIGATAQALNAPWIGGDTTYLSYNLTAAAGATNSPTVYSTIGSGATGSCSLNIFLGYDVQLTISIAGGTFTGSVGGREFTFISGGTFNGTVTCNATDSYISGGTFNGSVLLGWNDISASRIEGGTFNGSVTNISDYLIQINGGTFNSSVNLGAGNIYGGTFNSSVTFGNGNYVPSSINGGTFNGSVSGYGHAAEINGGTFNGSVSIDYYANIYSGTFNSGVTTIGSGWIYGGIFNSNVFNGGSVEGGTFFGSFSQDPESSFGLRGGTFEVTTATISFANESIPPFLPISWYNLRTIYNARPYFGIWSDQVWSAGVWVSIDRTYYYTNSGGGLQWGTLTNWNTKSNGSGESPTQIPWTGPETANYNLRLVPSGVAPQLNGILLGGDGTGFRIIGQCDRPFIDEIITNGYSIAAAL